MCLSCDRIDVLSNIQLVAYRDTQTVPEYVFLEVSEHVQFFLSSVPITICNSNCDTL